LAGNSDGRYLASGGNDWLVKIWDTRAPLKPIRSFNEHKKIITGLSFISNQNVLFSASHDRTMKLWNIDELAYVDTFYGHQSELTCVDGAQGAQFTVTGGTDHTCDSGK